MRLMKHNPAFLTSDELVRGFVVRQSDMELLLERIRDNQRDSNQHLLVIGPRGMGKTTLALRIASAVDSDSELSRRLFPLAFGEESYEVGTAAEFWLEALFHLGERTGQEGFQRIYRELKAERNEQRLYDQALGCLLDFADQQGKRLLVIVENLNQILGEQLSTDEGWKLRHTLLNEPRIMLLATALSRFDGIDRADQPMYDLFWVHELQPLTQEECRTLWMSITGSEEQGDRIRPVQILTGGNPRLLSILASFAARTSLHDLMLDLEQLVDDNTNYFKSHLESLPAAERKIYVTLADIWGPVTAREVAESARVEVNVASAMLHRLVRRGAVAEVKDNRSKKVRFQVAERLYNIYHLMRRRGDVSSRVKAATHFMVSLYRGNDLVNATSRIASEACQLEPPARRDHFQAYCDILLHPASLDIREQILKNTDARFFDLEDAPQLVRTLGKKRTGKLGKSSNSSDDNLTSVELRRHLQENPEDAELWFALGRQLQLEEKSFQESANAYREGLRREPMNWLGWFSLGGLLHFEIRDYQEAESAYIHALSIKPEDHLTWSLLGDLRAFGLKNYDSAIEAYQRSLNVKIEAKAYLGLGIANTRKMRYQEAEHAFQEAMRLQPEDYHIMHHYSELLCSERKFAESESILRKSIDLNQDRADAWFELGRLLQNGLARKNEAEVAYREALKRDKNHHRSWAALASLLCEQSDRFIMAEEAARRAIETGPDCISSWECIESLYEKNQNRLCKLEPTYRDLIAKYPGEGWPWGLLGILTECSLHDVTQAEQAYLNANSLASEVPILYRRFLRLLSKREDGLSISKKAEYFVSTAKRTPYYLNQLAWDVYAGGYTSLFPVAESWAREAVDRASTGERLHTLACLLGAQGKWTDALACASRFLEDAKQTTHWTTEVIGFFVDAAAEGYAAEALKVLSASMNRALLEPMEVALRIFLGQPHYAPQEIAEVAQDVVKRCHGKQKLFDNSQKDR